MPSGADPAGLGGFSRANGALGAFRPCWRGQNAGAPFTTTVARAPLGLGVKIPPLTPPDTARLARVQPGRRIEIHEATGGN